MISEFSALAADLQAGSNGAGAFTLNFPTPWSPSDPFSMGPPAVFTLDYPGFSGMATIGQSVTVGWNFIGSSQNRITVTATANFQNGANTITVPDLSSVGHGFFGCCPSSANNGFWNASVWGASTPPNLLPSQFGPNFVLGTSVPAGGTIAYVETSGFF